MNIKKWRGALALVMMMCVMAPKAIADEGMWLPYLLGNDQYKAMRRAGMKMSKDDIFSVNEACASRAVVGLVSAGPDPTHSFATGSLISEDGLVLTNFHCVMRYLGQYSLEANHDFLKYGYWSKDQSEESRCRDLSVKQLLRIEDVTDALLEGTEGLKGRAFTEKLNHNGHDLVENLTKELKAKGERGIKVKLHSLYANNQYIMSVYRIYSDVRMVAAAPQMIGMYGGTQDNWMWPRYTGDFALLRIYVNKDNQPARHSKKNMPLKTQDYLKIAKKGVQEGDFVMVMGYPARTQQYTPSFGIEGLIKTTEASVKIRGERVRIMQEAMAADEDLHARYLPTLSSVSNKYIKWKGILRGFREQDLVAEKKAEEKAYLEWCAQDASRKVYADAYNSMKDQYASIAEYRLAKTYFNECVLGGSEVIPYIGKFEKLVAMHTSKRALKPRKEKMEARRLIGLTKQFFQNWSYAIDMKTVRAAVATYYNDMPSKFWDPQIVGYIKEYNGDVDALIQDAFKNSMFAHPDSVNAYLHLPTEKRDITKITEDKLYNIAISFYKLYISKINRQLGVLQAKQTDPYRTYMKGYLEMHKDDHTRWADANGSQRISYGQVSNAQPEEAVTYRYYTDMKGLLQRAAINKGDQDYFLSKRFRGVIAEGMNNPKDNWAGYGYGDGSMRLCFMTNAHTTSGSSGSPVLNAKGELVGLNFDSMWQGTVSDYFYTGTNRSITTDIRYIQWVVSQYAKRDYLK